MKITLAQINPTIGDFSGNLAKVKDAVQIASDDNSDLLLFSELILSGYPPQDFLERDAFLCDYENAVDDLVDFSRQYPTVGILIGNLERLDTGIGKKLFNTALLIMNGERLFEQRKSLLPTYDVFDEARYFDAAEEIEIFHFKGSVLGITICEDGWNDPEIFPDQLYKTNPVKMMADKGADIILNISASPFGIGKDQLRFRLFLNHAKKFGKPIFLLNQVGGNDELISDGCSMAFDGDGNALALLPAFEEQIVTVDLENPPSPLDFKPMDPIFSVHKGLVLGIRDYAKKCGFQAAVLGLSGGIDSAVTACLAKEALGKENVLAISMPSPYSSEGSRVDAAELAKNLGIRFETIPIDKPFSVYLELLGRHLGEDFGGITEENIQARIRGNILMAISNNEGYLTLSSGNKSEMSVGYCTLYGDMSGGLSVLADVPKTMVYELARYINTKHEVIPKAILEKAPSAELKPEQKDEDTLPPYDILDDIIKKYLDEGQSKKDIIASGHEEETVVWVIDAIHKNEYKRRQAAPGLKILPKSFGIGRRMPIAAKYRS